MPLREQHRRRRKIVEIENPDRARVGKTHECRVAMQEHTKVSVAGNAIV